MNFLAAKSIMPPKVSDTLSGKPALRASGPALPSIQTHTARRRLFRALGVAGLSTASFFFIWLVLSLIGTTPSIVDTFGIPGLRIPAGLTIAGLLMAAIGFYDARVDKPAECRFQK